MQSEKRELTKAEKEEIARRIDRSACFQKIFRGPSGEKGLKMLDEWLGYRNDTFDPDSHKSAYKAGLRAAAIFIHNALDNDVKQIRKILKQKSQEK